MCRRIDAWRRDRAADGRGRDRQDELLRVFAAEIESAQRGAIWWGSCDALATPHPLAPLHDMARHALTLFASRLEDSRHALFEAVLDELHGASAPAVVVVEDAHWADEATLDLLKFIGRRIALTRTLLLVSCRDDELPASHALRRVVGEWPAIAVTRIELARLSRASVERVARRSLRSAGHLFDTTRGNPFFLSELLRHSGTDMPGSIRDLVLARFARLSPQAQAVARAVAIAPGGLEQAVLDTWLAPAPADLEASLVVADGPALRFRHELARVAVEEATPGSVARQLHAQLLCVLGGSSLLSPAPSGARLAHHAAAAGDKSAVRRHAQHAADEAVTRGAYREAARHFETLLATSAPAGDPLRISWLEGFADVCQRIDRFDAAIAAREALDALFAAAEGTDARGLNLSRLAIQYAQMLHNAEADATILRAIALLEGAPPNAASAAALGTAYGTEASLRMLNRDCAQSADWARRSIALARDAGDTARLCASMSTLGTAQLVIDHDLGKQQLEGALAMALAADMPQAAASAMLNLGSASGELMRIADTSHWLRRAIAYAADRELDANRVYSTAWLALCELGMGHWAAAAELAQDVLDRPVASTIARVMALIAIGRVRLRRGDPGSDAAFDEALALAGVSNTLQRIAPIRAARAESAFARGDAKATAAEAAAAWPLAVEHAHAWFIGELAFWRWRADALLTVPAGCAEPYALQIGGDWRGAAAAWQRLGCPYEEARALADGDAEACKRALTIFKALGAQPAATALERQLRAAGVRGVVRGVRASTRDHAFGLTTRELEVLRLVCADLRNADIAARLSRSVRTIDHHVAAVFAKLGVESRGAAVHAAHRAGIVAASLEEGARER